MAYLGIAYNETIFVDKYSDVVKQATGETPKLFLVQKSEINDNNQTIYHYDGNGNIFWVASVKVN